MFRVVWSYPNTKQKPKKYNKKALQPQSYKTEIKILPAWEFLRSEPARGAAKHVDMLLSNITYPLLLTLCFGWRIRIRPTNEIFNNLNSYLIHAQTSSPNRESGTPITLTIKNKNKIISNPSLN